jgi:hypothetical protein
MNYNLICIFICTTICTHLFILVKSGCYNSLIVEREGSTFLRKKGRMKNLAIGVAGPFHHGGGGLILQMESWLVFRRGAGGWCAGMNE